MNICFIETVQNGRAGKGEQEGRAEKIWALFPVLSLSQDNDLEQIALAKIFKSVFRYQNK